jgi:FkbH-like protein
LAIVSKNNEKDAISVLENHPDQILRLSSFSAYRINWRDKATNIQEIAIELGLGLDSFVFIDDNPVERAWVREALPEVKVVSVPDDPTHYVQCIRDIASLWQFRLTKEDLGRVSSYQQDKKRQSLKDRTKSYEEYLASLNMAVQIQPINDETLPRTVQLINKTNQFNLTTRRYSEADIVKMMRDTDNWLVISLHMTDVFQDYGQVGCAILSRDKDCVIIDVLLLSCRVLGRTIESVFLSAIIETSKKWGAKEVNGIFVPSHKNQQTEFFYPSHDFQKKISTGSSDQFIWKISTSYSLPLKSKISLELSLNKIHNATNLNKKQGENNDYN